MQRLLKTDNDFFNNYPTNKISSSLQSFQRCISSEDQKIINKKGTNSKSKLLLLSERNIMLDKILTEKNDEIDKLNDKIEVLKLENYELDEKIKKYKRFNDSNEKRKKIISSYIQKVKSNAINAPKAIEEYKKLIDTLEKQNQKSLGTFERKISKIDEKIIELKGKIEKRRAELKNEENRYEKTIRRRRSIKVHVDEANLNYQNHKDTLEENTKKVESKIVEINKKVNTITLKKGAVDLNSYWKNIRIEEDIQNKIKEDIIHISELNTHLEKENKIKKDVISELKKAINKIKGKRKNILHSINSNTKVSKDKNILEN